jgi:glycosyltransferase involved in cell wall biosynthesis
VGGIKEVVVPGETGLLVDLQLTPGTFDPVDPGKFARDLSDAINKVALDENQRMRFGRAGRRRVEDHFSWEAIAHRTLDLYRSLVERGERQTSSVKRQGG